jgi:ferredoxin
MKRKIIRIDETKCNGCGLCVTACHEGALQIVDGKARLVKESYCDGLGNCLSECPQDAIIIEEREADPFDEAAVAANLAAAQAKPQASPGIAHAGCPGLRAFAFAANSQAEAVPQNAPEAVSELRQWPVQLALVPTTAPYWRDADILVAADCVSCAYGNFQAGLLRGKRLIIACPKLDDTSPYVDKLTAILRHNAVHSITVAHMEVPCCTGIVRLVETAVRNSGKQLPLCRVKIGVQGELLEQVTKEP